MKFLKNMKSIKRHIDKHKGKMAFVLGSGPSLRHLNPELLKPHITIAVNEAILKVPSAEYFLSCDWGMPLFKAWETVKKSNCELILFNVDVGFSYLDNRTKVKAFNGILSERVSYFDFKKPFDILMNNESERLIQGSSSAHSAVHFAILLGCSPIVLLGCDCRYVEDKGHYTDFPNQPDGGYTKPEYEKIKPRYCFDVPKFDNTDAILTGHVTCWEKIKKRNPDVDIIDASEGDLDCFRKMSLKEILK